MAMIRTNILNPVSPLQVTLLKDYVITWVDDTITDIEPFDSHTHVTYEDHTDCVMCPGFIDLHVHLSQYYIRGQYRPALLPWLNEVVFPEESKSKDTKYAEFIAEAFYRALFKAGTTCSVVYTAPFRTACEAAFRTASKMGARSIIGMTLMDINSPEELMQSTEYALQNSIELFEQYNDETSLLGYIFTPRFAPTCSAELMMELGRYARSHSARIQTHLSENRDEIAWVREIFSLNSYTEVYEKYGILGENTILAHCIHLNDIELGVIKESGSKIAHCPDSNFYLKSGEFDLQRTNMFQIAYGLGSDVGAGTRLSMPYHAKMMNYRQSNLSVIPETAYYAITQGAANVLGYDNKIGSINIGKQADFVLLKPPSLQSDLSLLDQLIFFDDEFTVVSTYIAGRKVYSLSSDLS